MICLKGADLFEQVKVALIAALESLVCFLPPEYFRGTLQSTMNEEGIVMLQYTPLGSTSFS